MSKFGSSHLVQRLQQPIKRTGPFADNPFAFGGGLVNGGLSEDAMKLLRDIFSFDYMGAAEFEFGAVPEALSRIANSTLTAFTFEVEGRTIYALAPAEWQTDVAARIREFAHDYGRDYYRLKENTRLREVLDDGPYIGRLAGWLELDNGFMFFTDKEMWAKTCNLFGVAAGDDLKESA